MSSMGSRMGSLSSRVRPLLLLLPFTVSLLRDRQRSARNGQPKNCVAPPFPLLCSYRPRAGRVTSRQMFAHRSRLRDDHKPVLDHWGRAKVLQRQDTGLDWALTVAHAVWHFAGVRQWVAPRNARLPGRCTI